MQLDPHLKALRARFQLDQLLGPLRRREHFFLMGYRMRGSDIANARLMRSRAAPFRRLGRFRNAVWQPEPRGIVTPRDPIIVDTIELPSFASAETELLRLLGEFHVPVRLDPITGGPGDLAFSSPDESFVAVLRGNALIRLAQNRPTQSLLGVAMEIDTKLVTKPEKAEDVPDLVAIEPAEQRETLAEMLAPEAMPVSRTAPQFNVSAVRARGAMRLEDGSGDDGESEAPMFRFFSRGGWIEEQDELRFNLEEGEDQSKATLEVFEDGGGPARRCTCSFAGGRWHYDHDHEGEGA